jgi:hypothetical protein
VSASQLAREKHIRQQTLSRGLDQARSLPFVPEKLKPAPADKWTVERKARILAEASSLSGAELTAYLEREGVTLADYERWRIALEEGGRASNRQRSAFAVWAGAGAHRKGACLGRALLVLKKVETLYGEDEDDGTDGKS